MLVKSAKCLVTTLQNYTTPPFRELHNQAIELDNIDNMFYNIFLCKQFPTQMIYLCSKKWNFKA